MRQQKCVELLAVCAFVGALAVVMTPSAATAQSLPSPWVATNIGGPSPAGTSSYQGGQFTLSAGGLDIWDTSDQFLFVYQQVTGDIDIVARVVTSRMAELLGRPFVIDNRAGAGGVIATDATAKAAPDGYTLLLTSPNHTINAALNAKLPYDSERDLAPISIVADRRATKQIVVNLLSNAVKFTPEGGRVIVRSRLVEDSIVLLIADTGIGISPQSLLRLGRPFEQVESQLTKTYHGSGLGLAIARSLTSLHGGSMRLRSKLGAGTVVRVSLPRDAAKARANMSAAA